MQQSDRCDLSLRRRFEGGTLTVENGLWGSLRASQPGPEEVLLWAPLPAREGAVLEYRETSPGELEGRGQERKRMSGHVADPLGSIALALGALQDLRLFESDQAVRCCGSRLVAELSAERLVYRSAVHRLEPAPAPDIAELRSIYPVRTASDWAVCDWNAHPVDPLEAAGLLIARSTSSDGPSAYVLWRDVDGQPRGWEAFGRLVEPAALLRALNEDFRYAARDEELLVVDRSSPAVSERSGPLVTELVTSVEFARPPI